MSEARTVRLPVSGTDVEVDVRWLRAACACALCGDSTAGLRWLSLTDVGAPTVAEVTQAPDGVRVRWQDGHESAYPAATFTRREHALQLPAMPGQPQRFDYGSVVADDADLLASATALCRDGVALLDGCPTHDAAIVTAAERFGPIRVTSYGQVQVFRTEEAPKTAAHTGRAQHPHTDEPFRHSPPGFLFFHAVTAGPAGQGSTLLVDAVAIAEELRRDEPAVFETLCTVPVLQHRVHRGEVHFEAVAPVITVGTSGDVEGVRLNHRCLAPLDSNDARTPEVLEALTQFAARTEDPGKHAVVHLQSGQILAFDNHRVMHGRTSFDDSSARHLRSCNVDRDAVHSTLRTLHSRYGGRPEFRLLAGARP